MDDEKKYKEALEKLQEALTPTEDGCKISGLTRGCIENIFPELAESEDEKIRKEIISALKYANHKGVYDKHLAWLEKQGEQKSAEWHKGDEQNLNACLGYIPDEYLRRWLMDVIHVKYDKPTDKVEPKFKVGDWIIENGANRNTVQIKSFEEDNGVGIRVWFSNGTGTYIDFLKGYHKWTIKDAKPGDVLYIQHDGEKHIIIYKGVIKERFRTFVSAYCAYNSIVDAFCFADVSRYTDIAYGGIMPATKKQCDFLFQKMKEEGYEWDAEKKELKETKVVYEPDALIEESYQQQADDLIDMVTEKPVWSEEDVNRFRNLIYLIEHSNENKPTKEGFIKFINKLKSLKPQNTWIPSEEQMKALEHFVRSIGESDYVSPYDNNTKLLYSLLNDLKKLKR